jgi:hypothetical protein
MHPGNNYRAGASLLQDALDQPPAGQNMQDVADALNANGGAWSGYSVPLEWSPMLTVWRKLAIEVDSMDQESQLFGDRLAAFFEWDNCAVVDQQTDVPSSGFTTIECAPHDNHPGHPGINNYEGGGFVRNETAEEFLIVRNDPIPITLILWGDPGPDIVGVDFTVRDDDPYFADPNAPRQLPRPSLLDGNIVQAYRDAYIEIVEADSSLNLVNIVDWRSNLTAIEMYSDYLQLQGISAQWDLGSSNGYWARHLVVCYQPGTYEDGDGDEHENCGISDNCLAPNQPYPLGGLSALPNIDKVFGLTVRNEVFFDTALTTVYLETVRDEITDPTAQKLWQVVAHELGHMTLDQAGDTPPGGAAHAEGGLMSGPPEGNQLQDIPGMQRFTGITLRRFREAKRW